MAASFSGRFLYWAFLVKHNMKFSRHWRLSPELCGLSLSRSPYWSSPLLRVSSPSHWPSSWAGSLRSSQPPVSVARGRGGMVFSAANGRSHGRMVEWSEGWDGGQVFHLRFPSAHPTSSLCILSTLRMTILFSDVCHPIAGRLLHPEM